MSRSGESAYSSCKQKFFGFLPNNYLLLIILVGLIRYVVLLSDLMWPAKMSPNSKAEPAGTLLANLRGEG